MFSKFLFSSSFCGSGINLFCLSPLCSQNGRIETAGHMRRPHLIFNLYISCKEPKRKDMPLTHFWNICVPFRLFAYFFVLFCIFLFLFGVESNRVDHYWGHYWSKKFSIMWTGMSCTLADSSQYCQDPAASNRLKMRTICYTETLENFYQTTQRHIPEENDLKR